MTREDVLVIEDVADIRDTLRDVLELSGYRVRTAENGAAGLQALRDTGVPRVILLDLMMPVMDGWQVLETLRHGADAALAKLPVIVFSGLVNPEQAASLKQRFGCEVMSKPTDIDRLLQAVQAAYPRD